MRRLWLLFAQTVTVCLGILFIVSTLQPEWLVRRQAPKPAGGPLAASYASAVARAAPAVVNIFTSKQVRTPIAPLLADPDLARLFRDVPGFSQQRRTTALGSGVIVRSDGYVLTNQHVVEAAEAIEVALTDGRRGIARVVGSDPESDLAVLKLDMQDLPAITFGDGAALRVGDVVLAIGNPFGVGQTTTMGIVSALGRNRLGINIYENFIQTDAAINPGNSGGALVDTQGRLVGINTAIYSESGGSLGIGFAIPAAAARTILEQIVENGHVTRGWLGIEPQDMTTDLAEAFEIQPAGGVIIAAVLKDGPAARARLQVGDVVLAMDGQALIDAIDFLSRIAPLQPGETTRLKILRDGKEREVEVKVGQRPPQNSKAQP
ncbi:trypsin-like peptidase domain-containing protein [Pusillimonas sp. CC-YST705]|uniref:Trypsin-like peptidase domain-containing protein n=1 Tax=Mesopusillimonas faecipullorum TaxID=2755040 RepID=A0ABS8CCQ3_9BURK|nr:trypsin-like peptidase domain-containing protein [Mesopusillimonas faecipullorum]MCB5363634.1 trypsin-like peptidase domain-containing protein [Mesopusillimonas faecipullorum]